MSKKQEVKGWVVREWYKYGRWDRYIAETLYFEAVSKKDVLAQYHARHTPKYGAVIKVNRY